MMHEKIAQKIAQKLLDDNGYLRILPAATYEEFDWEELRLFCHFYARYGLPTLELVEWLKWYIGDKSAIEIGSGCGDLGRALGIPMTDNHCQEWPDVQFFYLSAGQPLIHYGENIERIDALEAAKKYKPDIIIGQWVTHWIDPTKPVPEGGGNIYGVKEDLLLKECKSYVMVGNRKVHGFKPILKMPHSEVAAPFIKSRAHQPEGNVIYIWGDQPAGKAQ
jgi:hypothetical protein